MNFTYNTQAPKRATNLSINSDLLEKAKSYKINLSKSFENYLNELVKQHEERQWKKENLQAIEEFNERVQKRGVFSDGLRRF
ncbi:type II toxin-antitoxin system CcdA family antitoxin [bacterium]|nr:type II toxin-antitoxin system CcdA family antitoxin [bacterium]MBU1959246.1 type II toxin-antitoxin system CcdA family antitoxin [bacterium]